MKHKLLIFALFACTAGAVIGYPRNDLPAIKPTPVVPPQAAAPKIEVVFALDTTGSMSGLIQAAKDNIWSIASSMASAQPAPELKIGLVAFRDRGDAYVTRVIQLSDDLDSLYATLMDFQAAGGGDGPESVNQALHDAVHKMNWSQDPDSYKVVFLVGDAPPHMDYADDVKYPVTLKDAAARGIVVNTIQAGGNPATRTQWQQIARLSQGEFFQVGQAGNAVAMTTPFDERIASLSKDLDDTRMAYGSDDERESFAAKKAATEKLHTRGSTASRAKRAAFNESAAGRRNLYGEKELIEDVASGKVELDALAPAELPAAVRSLGRAEQRKLIEQTAAQRAAIKAEIQQLNRQRRDYVEEQLAESKADEGSLDLKIFETVKKQAEEKGLSYADAPSY